MNEKMNCRCCNEMIDDEAILHYKNMPKGAQFFPDAITVTEDERTDLKLYQCKYCGLIQIMGEPVPYFKDVIRAAGISEEMKEYRRKYFQAFIDKYNLFDKKIIEIGAGCGEFLSVMNEIGVYGYGLEHLSESVETCREKGLNVFQGFIENRTTKIQQAPYDGFFIMNFLEHIPNPTEFLKGIFNNLKDEGIGLIEVPNVDMILEKLLFSEFIGDHLMYFTNESIRTLLNNNGFEIVSCEEVWHDYVLAVVVRKKRKINLTPFYNQLDKISTQMNKFVAEYKAEGKSIAVWGAGHQALALLSLTNIYKSVDVVIDSAPFKQNKYTPGTNIKVVAPTYLYENSIDMILVIAASYSDEVVGIISEKFPNIEIAVFREDGLGIVKSNKYMRINDEKNESNNETGDFKSNSKLL